MTFPQIDSTSLRTGGPARAEHWLRQVERSELAVPGPATLIGMGELAAEEARALTSVDWAKASIHAYELSARLFPESKQSAVDKAMLLRSWFIARLGSIKGDQLLDAETVADSFVADLPYSLEDALDKIKHWKRKDLPLASRLPIEDVRKLRNVKNRLAAIRLLVDSGNVAPNSPLLKWLVVQPDLP